MLGLSDCGHAAIYCFLCVGLPHCQHSAATLMISCTVTLAPSVYKTKYSNICSLLRKITWDSSIVWGGERIETYTDGVRCEVFSVENCMIKNMQIYWGNNI